MRKWRLVVIALVGLAPGACGDGTTTSTIGQLERAPCRDEGACEEIYLLGGRMYSLVPEAPERIDGELVARSDELPVREVRTIDGVEDGSLAAFVEADDAWFTLVPKP